MSLPVIENKSVNMLTEIVYYITDCATDLCKIITRLWKPLSFLHCLLFVMFFFPFFGILIKLENDTVFQKSENLISFYKLKRFSISGLSYLKMGIRNRFVT